MEQSPFSEAEPRLTCQESGAEHYYEPVESIPHSYLFSINCNITLSLGLFIRNGLVSWGFLTKFYMHL
jgi:hypothetical protein